MSNVQIVNVTWPERTEFPVSVSLVKQYIRVDGTDDDDVINTCIAAATAHVEGLTNRKFTEIEGVEGFLDAFPDCDIILPVPCEEITSVKYVVDGEYVDAGVGAAYLDTIRKPARVARPADGWPSDGDVVPNAVKVSFTASDSADVLELAKSAIVSIVAHWFEYREAFIINGVPDMSKMPSGLDRVINLLSLPRFG